MKQETLVVSLILLLIMPVYAHAQSPERISVIGNFGDFDKGEPLFIYGQVATIFDDSLLIMQIINPEGDLCQIQQLVPLPNGAFTTDAIPLKGRICGLVGEYDVKLFYGDYSTSANFHVTDKSFSEPNSDALVQSAKDLLSKSVSMIDKKFDVDPAFVNGIDDIISLGTGDRFVPAVGQHYSTAFVGEYGSAPQNAQHTHTHFAWRRSGGDRGIRRARIEQKGMRERKDSRRGSIRHMLSIYRVQRGESIERNRSRLQPLGGL